LAGIQPDPEGPGFSKIIIKPEVVGDVTWAKASCQSVRGTVATEWRIEAGKLELDIAIPVNSTATVFIPAPDAKAVTESGKPAGKAAGVKVLRRDGKATVIQVGSGRYHFVAPQAATFGEDGGIK
jgi:alpha-L-rhamnosidase